MSNRYEVSMSSPQKNTLPSFCRIVSEAFFRRKETLWTLRTINAEQVRPHGAVDVARFPRLSASIWARFTVVFWHKWWECGKIFEHLNKAYIWTFLNISKFQLNILKWHEVKHYKSLVQFLWIGRRNFYVILTKNKWPFFFF